MRPATEATEAREAREPGQADSNPHAGAVPGDASLPTAADTLAALNRIGAEVQLDVVADAAACLAAAERREVDLVVLDRCMVDCETQVLETLEPLAVPVIVVIDAAAPEERALEAFRAGAADCARAGPDYVELLPIVALEQIRRWRQQRERSRSQDRIESLERLQQAIVNEIPVSLAVVDGAGRIVDVNPEFERTFGVKVERVGGAALEDVLPEELHTIAGEPDDFFPRLVRCNDETGEGRAFDVRCRRLGDSEQRLLALSDVSQNEALARKLGELQRQVLQAEKMASIGQLAAGVAHEINNPMGFIHANLQQMSEYVQDLEGYWQAVDVLQSSIAAGDAEKVTAASRALHELAAEVDLDFVRRDFGTAVRESQEGSERIRHIVRDLRDFSHQGSVDRTFADVNQCVDSTASIVWTMMRHIVVLEKDYGELPEIGGFPMQLKQVFMNLLVNACQAVQEVVGDKGETGKIRVVTRAEDEGVRVTISDTGAGISLENQKRIFEPFFTTKDVGSGMGLGLSTSYGIVQRHGGRMTMESEPGRGSSFSVWLPLVPPGEDAAVGGTAIGPG